MTGTQGLAQLKRLQQPYRPRRPSCCRTAARARQTRWLCQRSRGDELRHPLCLCLAAVLGVSLKWHQLPAHMAPASMWALCALPGTGWSH